MPHDIDILIEDDRWQGMDLVTLATTAVAQVLEHAKLAQVELSVLACDDARISVLNADFRDKPTPTNVLSWPEEDLNADTDGNAPHAPTADPDGIYSLGDIAIAYDTCAREAAAQNKPMDDHVTHLIVHGVLHLLGYDHIRDNDAAVMEALEVKLLGKMGVPDPY
ncbi:MAG: rRNA maturation RNase YbeY [Tateyamaria sp.]|uniref:rRNA maturation RNase YbeY n=1 Tax=Tateyamaria sp. TaxID=1929288 RepID=UPI0032832F1E